MSSEALSARELSRRLVTRATEQNHASDSAALAVQTACERAYRELTRSLGTTGSRALLMRALVQAQAEHPVLGAIRIGRPSEPGLDGVSGIVQTHGAAAVTAGLDAVLETLLGLLGRLVGDDMVARLVERTTPNGTQEDEDDK